MYVKAQRNHWFARYTQMFFLERNFIYIDVQIIFLTQLYRFVVYYIFLSCPSSILFLSLHMSCYSKHFWENIIIAFMSLCNRLPSQQMNSPDDIMMYIQTRLCSFYSIFPFMIISVCCSFSTPQKNELAFQFFFLLIQNISSFQYS